ncbi:MAG: MarR family transcriptional regulator [Acidobacteriota bacterium]
MQLLWAVAHRMETTSKRMGRDFGVTGPQRLALRVIGLYPGLSAGDLAAVLHVHPSTLTGVLRRLIAQGLLVRRDDPDDRRRAVLRLTAAGSRANIRHAGTVETAVAEALAAADVTDVYGAQQVLGRLASLLDGAAVEASSTAIGRGARRSQRRR